MKKDQRLLNKAYKYLFGLTAFFFFTAVAGALVGKEIDEKFDIKPMGTLGVLLGFYVISWIIGKLLVMRFNKEADNQKKSKR